MSTNSLLSATHTDVLRKKSLNRIFDTFCSILFKYTQSLYSGNSQDEPQNIFDRLESFLKQNMVVFSSSRTASTSFIDEDLGEALYAMCALADEIFLNIEWEGKKFWAAHLLEEAFFNTHVSGELIFQRIDNLLLEGNALFVDLAEIYLKMLALGFAGKYRGNVVEKDIDNYRDKLYIFIISTDHSASIKNDRLFDNEYTNSFTSAVKSYLPDIAKWNYAIATFIMTFFIFGIVYWFFDTREISKKMQEIEEIAVQDSYE